MEIPQLQEIFFFASMVHAKETASVKQVLTMIYSVLAGGKQVSTTVGTRKGVTVKLSSNKRRSYIKGKNYIQSCFIVIL